jgi:hypothetical protein
LNSGIGFYKLQVLEIIPGLGGSSEFACFFFFFEPFNPFFCFLFLFLFFGFDSIGLAL